MGDGLIHVGGAGDRSRSSTRNLILGPPRRPCPTNVLNVVRTLSFKVTNLSTAAWKTTPPPAVHFYPPPPPPTQKPSRTAAICFPSTSPKSPPRRRPDAAASAVFNPRHGAAAMPAPSVLNPCLRKPMIPSPCFPPMALHRWSPKMKKKKGWNWHGWKL